MTKKPYFSFSGHFFTDCLFDKGIFKRYGSCIGIHHQKLLLFTLFCCKNLSNMDETENLNNFSYKKLACLESHTEKCDISLAILLNTEKTFTVVFQCKVSVSSWQKTSTKCKRRCNNSYRVILETNRFKAFGIRQKFNLL